jgi:formate C-acetyltransferase
LPEDGATVFAVEYLPGQFDQRADSAAQCIQLFSQGERPTVRTARVYLLYGNLTDDQIAAIKKYVYDEKSVSAHEMIEAVKANFEGYEEILAMCRGVKKYGSDSEHSNYHVGRLSRATSDIVTSKSRPYLDKYGLTLTPAVQSDTWNIKYGETYGATVDGRLAGANFSQNSRPSNGSCINGITGMLNSVLCIAQDGFLSGALNLDINPEEYKGEKGVQMFGAILASYFNRGGLHAQVSSVGAQTLIDAKRDPDSHRDLRVRVTGYSGIFVDMCERLQDDIIERTKNGM